MNKNSEKWDKAASDYQRTYSLGQSDYSSSMLDFWERSGMLRRGMRVLDIGCGVGKYGVYLAERGCDVTLTDISGEMLRHARENMSRFDTPWTTVQCDFDEVRPEDAAFSSGFDFSISTMSPAIHDPSTVARMTEMTRGFCFVTRFYKWEQPFRDTVLTALGIEPRSPHRDLQADFSEIIQAISACGYVPHIKFVDYCWSDLRTPAQAADIIARNYFSGDADRPDTEDIVAAIEPLCRADGLVEDAVNTKVAWIYWKGEQNDT